MPPGHRPAKSVSRARQGGDEDFVPAPRPARGPLESSRPAPSPQAAPPSQPSLPPAQAPKQPAPQRSGREPRGAETKLTSLESRILAFEARWWRASGAKTQAISDELELTAERYYQHLARLIDHPEAVAEQPAVVRRLKAARDQRRAQR
jgi:hypothetical protein